MLQYLIDTNVLVYCFDRRSRPKRKRAIDIVEKLGTSRMAALPAQALAEFVNVATRRFDPAMSAALVYEHVELLEQSFPIIPLTSAVVLEAIRGVRDHGFAYYDAQIWAVARLSQIPFVLSEDFNPGFTVEGVGFVDPFSEDID